MTIVGPVAITRNPETLSAWQFNAVSDLAAVLEAMGSESTKYVLDLQYYPDGDSNTFRLNITDTTGATQSPSAFVTNWLVWDGTSITVLTADQFSAVFSATTTT